MSLPHFGDETAQGVVRCCASMALAMVTLQRWSWTSSGLAPSQDMTCAFLASCSSRASPRCFGARCVLICHKSVRFLKTCLAGHLCVSIELVTHNHACRIMTHSATTPLDKYMLFPRAWESCQSIQLAFFASMHGRLAS